MKKFWFFLIAILLVFEGKEVCFAAAIEDILSDQEIYVFTQATCPHCQAAEAYLKEKYSTLPIQLKDISDFKNRQMFFACGAKFGLKRTAIGTPLFCMKDHYIIGWSETARNQFETYVKEFLPEAPQ